MAISTKVLIIGSGPAGLTSAIYAARAQLGPIVIEGEPSSTSDQPGGQLMLTTEVENFPGFTDGIMGPELMGQMRAQAERFGADLRSEKISRLDLSARPFRAWVGDTEAAEATYEASVVILATGARALMLNVPGEDRLLGHGVSTCATCDGFFFRGQEIMVVGGGDSALEEATFLTRFADKVILVHRRDSLRASKIMQERAMANEKIEFLWNAQITEIHGDTKVASVSLVDTVTGAAFTRDIAGVFVAIGHQPATDIFADQLDLHGNGYLAVHDGSRTSIDGVFACGDVADHTYRQAITAAGTGCMAAIDAERWLEAQGS
ncbi:MAG: thioredoxin-disulfide reductase [Actinomycetes bacterium]